MSNISNVFLTEQTEVQCQLGAVPMIILMKKHVIHAMVTQVFFKQWSLMSQGFMGFVDKKKNIECRL